MAQPCVPRAVRLRRDPRGKRVLAAHQRRPVRRGAPPAGPTRRSRCGPANGPARSHCSIEPAGVERHNDHRTGTATHLTEVAADSRRRRAGPKPARADGDRQQHEQPGRRRLRALRRRTSRSPQAAETEGDRQHPRRDRPLGGRAAGNPPAAGRPAARRAPSMRASPTTAAAATARVTAAPNGAHPADHRQHDRADTEQHRAAPRSARSRTLPPNGVSEQGREGFGTDQVRASTAGAGEGRPRAARTRRARRTPRAAAARPRAALAHPRARRTVSSPSSHAGAPPTTRRRRRPTPRPSAPSSVSAPDPVRRGDHPPQARGPLPQQQPLTEVGIQR